VRSISIWVNKYQLFSASSLLNDDSGECQASMFSGGSQIIGGKTVNDDVIGGALLSCQAQRALQRNWFPDPIGGLFSYQVQTIYFEKHHLSN
jgi:hypothetical protein